MCKMAMAAIEEQTNEVKGVYRFTGTDVLQPRRRNLFRYSERVVDGNNNNYNSSNNNHDSESSHATSALTKATLIKSVQAWRRTVLAVLISFMIGVSVIVYVYTSNEETNTFQNDFSNDAEKIIESISKSIDYTLSSIDALVVGMLSTFSVSNQTWPFVTIPNFDQRASKIRALSRSAAINLYPFVSLDNRPLWEQYTKSDSWVEKLIDVQKVDGTYNGPPLTNFTPVNVIYDIDDITSTSANIFVLNHPTGTNRTDPPFYLPVWQHSPVAISPPYNFDMLSPVDTNFSNNPCQRSVNALYAVLRSRLVIISEARFHTPHELNEDLNGSDHINPNSTKEFIEAEPVSDIHFPIFNKLRSFNNSSVLNAINQSSDDITSAFTQEQLTANDSATTRSSPVPNRYTGSDTQGNQPLTGPGALSEQQITALHNSSFVGLLSLSIYWKHMMTDILPARDFGLIVVFDNPCNSSFTYRVVGPNVTYIGQGDQHDKRFDFMKKEAKLIDEEDNVRFPPGMSPQSSYYSMNDVQGPRLYRGTLVDTGYCPFTINVYPDIVMKNHYHTARPMLMACGAALIFLFTSTIFLIYNHWVERRQREVMTCAVQSMINANELDKIVQERTITLRETNTQLERASAKVQQASLQQLEHFACMSHEIRTPLNGINGLSSVVRYDMERLLSLNQSDNAWETVQDVVTTSIESMDMIVSSGELLRRIVDDVLDFAKLGSGKVEIDIQNDVPLQDIFDTVISSIESNATFHSKKLSIKTYYGASVAPTFATDSRRLQQILYNLLGNAVKFSREGGVVELHAFHHEIPVDSDESHRPTRARSPSSLRHRNDDVENGYNDTESPFLANASGLKTTSRSSSLFGRGSCSSCVPDAGTEQRHSLLSSTKVNTEAYTAPVLRFVVKDYGRGIRREKFQAIFEPFIQAEGANTEQKHGGTGLGLAITSRLVQVLGGTISVASEFGHWTEFIIDFPFNPTNKPQQRHDSHIDSSTIDTSGVNSALSEATVHIYSTVVPAWTTMLSEQLRNVNVFLVDDNTDDRQQIEKVFFAYNVFHFCCEGMNHLTKYLEQVQSQINQTGTSTICVILIREDLVDKETFDSVLCCQKVKLIKFGPKLDAQETSHGRFRTLVRMLPSILMQNLVDISKEHTPERRRSLTEKNDHQNALSNLKILIAEDNKINQKVLLRILNRLNVHNITVVENGRDAVDMESKQVFDVILMDMHMPIMDGIGACKEIMQRKVSDAHPRAKLIFLTAHVNETFRKQCFEVGAYGFLSKPCTLQRLQDCLNELYGVNDDQPSSNKTSKER